MAEREDISKELTNLKADMGEVRDHLGSLTRAVKDVVKAEGSEAKARFEKQAQDILDKMVRMLEEAKLQSRRAYETVEHTVQERPMTSVLTSLGVGVAVGFIISKLLSRRD